MSGLQRGIMPGSVKAEIGTRAWELLARYSETYPPQSITVEIKCGDYTYRGTAYLVEQGEETPQPARVAPPLPEQSQSYAQAEAMSNGPSIPDHLIHLLADEKGSEAVAKTIFKQAFLNDAVDGLFHARHDAGLTPEQMAERLGRTREDVLKLEGDATGSMTLHQYADLALAYGMAPILKLVPIEQARQEAIRQHQEESA